MKTKQELKQFLESIGAEQFAKIDTEILKLELDTNDLDLIYELLTEKYGKLKLDSFYNTLGDLQSKMNGPSLIELDQTSGKNAEELIKKYTKRVSEYYAKSKIIPTDVKIFHFLVDNIGNGLHQDEMIELISKLKSVGLDVKSLSIASKRAKNAIVPSDNVTRNLQKLKPVQNVLYAGKYKNETLKTLVTLEIPSNISIDGGMVQLSAYDRSIINGVASVMAAGNTAFSIPMLYHAMTGKENPMVKAELLDDLREKLRTLSSMRIKIDLSEESIELQNQKNDIIFEGYLLPLNNIRATLNGKTTEMYQIIQMPPIYSYASHKRQLSTVPLEILNVPLNNNKTTIPLKNYLLARIEGMKNRHNILLSDKILYQTVYEELGEQQSSRAIKKRIREYTTTILDWFINKTYILSYNETTKGKTIDGIIIHL